ncbi:phosphate transport system permease protein PstC [Candidatus Termititenax persephonae]|uniref:Phosphate transport system permease protein n=1 Tax=Candidatus Termititenax persephonae TaxID=2218525 RepID=A0A388TI75_9BACT|nr:phosphate transport system permease protein PstC [Candidatus Termititenax persephonae]
MLPSLSLPAKENIFQQILVKSAFLVAALVLLFFLTLLLKAWTAIGANGLSFFTGVVWNPLTGEYGVLPFLTGTLLTSVLALGLALPCALSIAIFLGEFFRSGWSASLLRLAVELLAGLPSVVYGFWALFVLVPLVRQVELWLGVLPLGVGVLVAALVLAIMIVPYAASLSAEVIKLVPSDIREAAYSLGATRFEVLRYVILPYVRSGILAGVLLAFGRGLGETMAVTMVIGNANKIPASLFDTGNTMASLIANELTEALDLWQVSSLAQVGLLLFGVSALVNLAGRYVIKKFSVEL